MFFEAERQSFFRPLNGKRRELVAACLRSLYERLHGPGADYAQNLTRDSLRDLLMPVINDHANEIVGEGTLDDLTDIIRNMKAADNASYNSTFTYPAGGAIEYVKAIASAVDPSRIALEEALVSIDVPNRVARTSKRSIRYERLVSSAPFPRLVDIAAVPHDRSAFTWNKVLVFNLGFDRKGKKDVHWVYYPEECCS